MPILGILASSRPAIAADTGAMFPLQVVTVGAAGASSITFSNIPNTYSHLQVRMIARDTRAVTLEGFKVQFNSDTSTNYSDHALYGDGSSASAYANVNAGHMSPYAISSANASANVFGVSVIDILDYASTNKYKTIRALTGVDNNGSGALSLTSGNWRNTNAITSITIGAQVGNLVQYSQFALYGVKGAA